MRPVRPPGAPLGRGSGEKERKGNVKEWEDTGDKDTGKTGREIGAALLILIRNSHESSLLTG